MNENYIIRLLFPSSFHEYYLKENFDRKKLIDYCYLQKKLDPEGRKNRSNNGGWHSKTYKINDDSPISDVLKKGLANSLFSTIRKNLSLTIEYWIMIIDKNAYHNAHFHPNSHCSGVLWIKIPKNSGDTRFTNPFLFQGYNEIEAYVDKFQMQTNTFNSYDYHPQEGLMVTFPSYVFHEVRPNKTNEDRIAVSYNISFNDPDIAL